MRISEQFIFACVGNENIINLLLENNATNVNAVNRDGHTALDVVNTAVEGKLKITVFEVVNQKKANL